MIRYVNSVVKTKRKYLSVSRPRRFGKTMAADMLCAYYERSADSRFLFEKTLLGKIDGWDVYLGKYDVIRIVMTDFIKKDVSVENSLKLLAQRVLDDLCEIYPEVKYDSNDLAYSMNKFYHKSQIAFVIVIDEWDAVFRVRKTDKEGQTKYLDFLRDWLKDKEFIALAYMTGILPIKKYGQHSALNMFNEYSMLNADPFAEFVGFTESEVQKLCQEYNRDFDKCKRWYDGYQIGDLVSIYNPRSVNMYISSGIIDTYWNNTETYEALRIYISIDGFGIHDAITDLLAGIPVSVDTGRFTNTMKTFKSRDDILTLLIHLGYLSYNKQMSSVHIPNKEISKEFIKSVEDGGWPIVVRAIKNSEELLSAVFDGDEDKVAQGIEDVHMRETSILKYNDL